MPYIPKDRRGFTICNGAEAESPGELNYFLTIHTLMYLGSNPNYSKFNEVIGVLESIKLELYRRMIAPYEDNKKEENGDVY